MPNVILCSFSSALFEEVEHFDVIEDLSSNTELGWLWMQTHMLYFYFIFIIIV